MADFDVHVLGTGIVGRCLALALSRSGLSVALTGEAADLPVSDDLRAYALSRTSVELLRSLKVWDALPAHAATPVHDIRVQGDTDGASLAFSAWEQHVDALAWIVDAGVLERELANAVRFAPHVVATAPGIDVSAALTALCEGKASTSRAALGVAFDRQPYGHKGVAARLTSTVPHRGTARQWFRSPDILALLPFDTPQPASSYGLVWSVPDEHAAELLALDAGAFEARLMEATQGAAGELHLASERAAWPLMRAQAERWCGPGWVLLGDCAHVVHPLAGQGLNLGLADVVTLVDVLSAREPWRALGDERLLRRYERERLAPTWAMGHMTDGLWRLFAQESPAWRELRHHGLNLVNRLTPVKRWLTARALES